MAFKKGMSGNPKGRPAGAKDKKSEKLREWLLEVVDKNRQSFAEDLAAVDPATRWNIIAKILPYVLPRLNAVTIEQERNDVQFVWVEMPGPDEYKESGIGISSSEEEVLAKIEQEALEKIEQGELNGPVVSYSRADVKKVMDEVAARNEEQRAHQQLVHQQRLQQRRHSKVIRQF